MFFAVTKSFYIAKIWIGSLTKAKHLDDIMIIWNVKHIARLFNHIALEINTESAISFAVIGNGKTSLKSYCKGRVKVLDHRDVGLIKRFNIQLSLPANRWHDRSRVSPSLMVIDSSESISKTGAILTVTSWTISVGL